MAPESIILLDVEGTTTPIDFVFGTLFPFAAKHLPSFVHVHHDNSDVLRDLEHLRNERLLEPDRDAPECGLGSDPIPYLLWLISKDRKSPALKSLQGKIWEIGYRERALKGAVFSDVPRAFERWQRDKRRVYIYSSGSVLAQKLLFQFSEYGDLTPYLSGHFDTAVGAKTESDSYGAIGKALKPPPDKILFISDIVSELLAASNAGCECILSLRPGNKPNPNHHFRQIETFDSVG